MFLGNILITHSVVRTVGRSILIYLNGARFAERRVAYLLALSTLAASPLPFVGVKLAGNPFADYCLSIQYPERRSIPCPFRAPSLVSATVVSVVLSTIRRSRLQGLSRRTAMDMLGDEQDSF